MNLCIYPSIYLPTYLPTYLKIYLSTYLPIYLSVDLPIYLSIYLSIYCQLEHGLTVMIYHAWLRFKSGMVNSRGSGNSPAPCAAVLRPPQNGPGPGWLALL